RQPARLAGAQHPHHRPDPPPYRSGAAGLCHRHHHRCRGRHRPGSPAADVPGRRDAMSARLAGRAILVTGASVGIGRAIALRLAAEGASLVLTAAPADATLLADVAEKCATAVARSADLSDADVPAALIALSMERFGRIDGLVNNAMAEVRAAVGEADLDGWELTLRVSLTAPMLLAQAALPHFRRQRR